MKQIYRRNIIGVLCGLVLLATVVRTPYEVNISLPYKKYPTFTAPLISLPVLLLVVP